MRFISLWQPWASLWLSGVKIHETRHWPIQKHWRDWKPGDRLGVHAAKRFEKDHHEALAEILRRTFGPTWYKDLPTGALLGTIQVTACLRTEDIFGSRHHDAPLAGAERCDFECGNFDAGRFGWRGANPILFPLPLVRAGGQGFFNVPDELLPRLAA